jgi:hypothetical protein
MVIHPWAIDERNQPCVAGLQRAYSLLRPKKPAVFNGSDDIA